MENKTIEARKNISDWKNIQFTQENKRVSSFNIKEKLINEISIKSELKRKTEIERWSKKKIPRIRNQIKLPLIIDAGLGQASDATIAMELGCDAVLINTAIAKAKNPFQMALAMKNAVLAGRSSYLSGRIIKSNFARPSSPLKGKI